MQNRHLTSEREDARRRRLVVLQAVLPHYRRDFFNGLAQHHEVVVVHSGPAARNGGDRFDERVLPYVSVGPFRIQFRFLETLRTLRPDVVIAGDDMRWLMIPLARLLSCRSMKWVWWGVDVNRKRYVHTIKARFIIRSGDAKVFYDRQTMESLLEQGISRHGSFVANNTVLVAEAESLHAHPVKRSFINVGSLLPRKQNEVLIAVFKRVRARTGKDLELVLIGDGPERQRLSELVRESELGGAVKILPKIEDPKLLKEYYREAIASVSFGQAGLAVLQSMAFGVPFVTKKNAISGGEINNIVSGENGILCEDSVDALEEAMSSLVLDQELARRLGAGAHSYYVNHASMDGMVSGFLQAIDWAMSRG